MLAQIGAVRVERRNNFDALRLIAAAGVIFSHAYLIGEGRQDGEPLMRLTGGQTILGVVGVFIFFTISGYLVTQSFEATGSALRFAMKRALRIYPGLLVCLLLCAFALGPSVSSLPLGDYVRDSGAYRFAFSNFIMVEPTRSLPGVWFTKWDAGGVVNGPLWTLPCEVLMYLMVLALGLLRALDLRIMAVLIALGLGGIWFDTAASEYVSGSALWLLAFFAAGMVLYRLRDRAILDGRLALLACAGVALSIPLNAFILLFPIFGQLSRHLSRFRALAAAAARGALRRSLLWTLYLRLAGRAGFGLAEWRVDAGGRARRPRLAHHRAARVYFLALHREAGAAAEAASGAPRRRIRRAAALRRRAAAHPPRSAKAGLTHRQARHRVLIRQGRAPARRARARDAARRGWRGARSRGSDPTGRPSPRGRRAPPRRQSHPHRCDHRR